MTSSGDGSKGKSERKHKRSSIAISDGTALPTDITHRINSIRSQARRSANRMIRAVGVEPITIRISKF